MNRPLAIRAARLSSLALAAALAACGIFDSSNDKAEYRSGSGSATPAKPLDVPPDLTQLSRDSRYAQQGGVVSAAAVPGAASGATPSVAVQAIGTFKVERDGSQRWLVTTATPEQLWPRVRAFWVERGFTIANESADAGVIETDWAENRTKLANDTVRNALTRALGSFYDTGERDRFRTRIERTATGCEVYVSHRGMKEVYSGERRESTVWETRPSDPQLEAEFLSRLMVALGSTEEGARNAVASATETPSRARALTGANAALEVDEPFDRAWRRVGLALDRTGFTVEDRDRAGGLYYVRYVDPKNAGKDEPGFFSRLFGLDKDEQRGPLRYRVALKAAGEKTQVSVLTSAGAPEAGENAQRIIGQLVNELR